MSDSYKCPECYVDLAEKNEDIRAHAASHWGGYKIQDLSPEGAKRYQEMLDEAKRRDK